MQFYIEGTINRNNLVCDFIVFYFVQFYEYNYYYRGGLQWKL